MTWGTHATYGKDYERVRETLQAIEGSSVKHEIVLEITGLQEADIKDAASQVPGTFVLYGDRGFDELRAVAGRLTGPKHIRIRNRGAEQSIS